MSLDFYEILDVSPDASDGEITNAYRRKVKEYHPDRNDHPRAHAQFKVLNKAHDVLGDPVERAAYDRLGHGTYVRKRIPGGLPLRDFTNPASASESANVTPAGSRSGGPSENRRSGTGTSARTTGTATTDTATGANATDRSNRGRARSGRSGARTASGSNTYATGRTSSRRRRSNTGRSGRANRTGGTRSGNSQAWDTTPTKEYSISLLWLFLLAASGPYVAALASFGRQNVDGIVSLVAAVTGGSIGTSVFTGERFGIESVGSAVQAGVTETSLVGIGVVLGAVVMPLAFAVAVYQLRTRTVWDASPGYVLAAGAPLAGIGLNLAGVTILPLDVLLFVGCPAGAIGVFLYYRFLG